MQAGLAIWDLFSKSYPKCRLKWKEMPHTYVSEAITSDDIMKWQESAVLRPMLPFVYPVLISAQTGSGKNYFITHVLREYARLTNHRILYVSNRNALDFQQKKEIAELTGIPFRVQNRETEKWEEVEEFQNITLFTYQKLYHHLLKEDAEKWCQKFRFVILDECHFFYSDAFFNPHTWDLLSMIPKFFAYSVRIYMSATFDDVLEPIRYWEGKAESRYLNNGTTDPSFDNSPFAYVFPRDFSRYTTYYFSTMQQIIDQISQDQSSNKWLIFVTNKQAGIKMKDILNGKTIVTDPEELDVNDESKIDLNSDLAIYLDAESRISNDFSVEYVWRNLRETGIVPSKVLITTAVLDNGFSIKDSKIKNIVLFTHDKTEFLQELGRCRLTDGKSINVYIKKMNPLDFSHMKNDFKNKQDIILSFCGNKDRLEQSDFYTPAAPAETVKRLWSAKANPNRSFISLSVKDESMLSVKINQMARWRIKLMEKYVEKCELLFQENNDRAPILCKEGWLSGTKNAEETCYSCNRDLDYTFQMAAQKKLQEFLEKEASSGNILDENDGSFDHFSTKFQELYKNAFPKDPSINRGKNRKSWREKAIMSHLDKLCEAGIRFKLEPHHEKSWQLIKED